MLKKKAEFSFTDLLSRLTRPLPQVSFSVFVALLLLASVSKRATAQGYQTNIHSGYNMKGYSVEHTVSDYWAQDVYVSAGTVDKSTPGYANEAVHVIVFDAAGSTLTSKILFDAESDLMAVDVVRKRADEFYVICLQRIPSPAKDVIRVYHMDVTGTVLSNEVIRVDPFLQQQNYSELYPTHGLWHQSKLYICGYSYQTGQVAHPAAPPYPQNTLGWDNRAFILSYNPSTLSVQGKMWTTSTGPNNPDYDMATRMKVIGNNILVLGAANNTTGSFTTPVYRSRSLAIMFNPSLVSQYRTSFSQVSVLPSTDPYGQYSIDAEDDGSGGVFILSNHFLGSQNRAWDLSHIDPLGNVLTVPGGSRLMRHIDHLWGNQLFKTDQGKYTVIGQQDRTACVITNGALPTSVDNINPFINRYSFVVAGVGGINMTQDAYFVETSLYGTRGGAVDYLTWNDGLLANVGRYYTFAARTKSPTDPDWVFISPVSEKVNSGALNYKFNRIDHNTDQQLLCSTTHDEMPCVISPYFTQNTLGLSLNNFSELNPNLSRSADYEVFIDDLIPDYSLSCNIHFRGQGLNTRVEKQSELRLLQAYTDPAGAQVSFSFNRELTKGEEMHVDLYDMTGRIVLKRRISASQHGEKIKLQLPDLAAGAYFASITVGKQVMRQQIAVQ